MEHGWICDLRFAPAAAARSVWRKAGWASATVLPTSHGSLTISDLLERYHRSAVSRGLRPRSIAAIEKEFRRISAQVGARRLADLTPVALQQWVENCGLKPVTLKALLKNAACPFSRPSLQAMGMAEVQNPFAKLVRPKVDPEPFDAPSRSWITGLTRAGIKELTSDVQRAASVRALPAPLSSRGPGRFRLGGSACRQSPFAGRQSARP